MWDIMQENRKKKRNMITLFRDLENFLATVTSEVNIV